LPITENKDEKKIGIRKMNTIKTTWVSLSININLGLDLGLGLELALGR